MLNKDILGNDIDEKDLEALESKNDEEQEPEINVLDELENKKEVEVDLEPRLTRREKKQNRWREHTERAEEERRARMDAERRAEMAEERLRRLEQSYTPPVQQKDDTDRDLEELYRAQTRLVENYNAKATAGAVTQETTEAFQREAREISNKLVDKRIEAKLKGYQQSPNGNAGEVAIQAQLMTQYPEVYNNPAALQYAKGLFSMKTSRGAANSLETVHQVLQSTRKEFGFSGDKEYDDGMKRRLSGNDGNGPAANRSSNKIKITKSIVKIANSAFKNLKTEEERVKKWIEVYGKEYRDLENEEK